MKRFFDLLVALLLGILSFPFALVLYLIVWIKLGRPVLFTQRRPGLHGEIFILFKFRTMRDLRNTRGEMLPDEQRLTSFGQFLRSSSLDELPSLWNVVRGDMSLVGPRPLLEEYLPLYSSEQALRHTVKPGITGWAQVNGRNTISWEEKLELDVWYVQHRTFLLDMKILYQTISKVIKKDGISHDTSATMHRFGGTKSSE